MKKIIIALVYILFAKVAFAQQDLLSFDEHNKYIYYQVVDMPGMSADSLHARGLSFLKTAYPAIKLKSTANANNITGQGKFLTYGGISVLKHEKGEMGYQLNIEFKDQKYRYWLTGFVFTPYQRDRYGNFVPQQGIEVPLEDAASKFDKKDVDGYRDETGSFCKQFGDKLKLFKVNMPKKEESIKKVVTDKW
jgi:hypothetical protein